MKRRVDGVALDVLRQRIEIKVSNGCVAAVLPYGNWGRDYSSPANEAVEQAPYHIAAASVDCSDAWRGIWKFPECLDVEHEGVWSAVR